jgi:hypothetical protein
LESRFENSEQIDKADLDALKAIRKHGAELLRQTVEAFYTRYKLLRAFATEQENLAHKKSAKITPADLATLRKLLDRYKAEGQSEPRHKAEGQSETSRVSRRRIVKP